MDVDYDTVAKTEDAKTVKAFLIAAFGVSREVFRMGIRFALSSRREGERVSKQKRCPACSCSLSIESKPRGFVVETSRCSQAR
jgi:hypothetical protein